MICTLKVWPLALLLACNPKPEETPIPEDSEVVELTDDAYAATLTGTFDWTMETRGQECTFSFDYEGARQIDWPWLCASCDLLFFGTATLTDGEDCRSAYNDLEHGDETASWPQVIGLDTANGSVWLSPEVREVNFEAQAGLTIAEGTEIVMDTPETATFGGGSRSYKITGSLRYELDRSTVLPDPFPPRNEPYACGWPQNNPGDLPLDYATNVGETFPNVRLPDQCGDEVDIWDFTGSYLLIEVAQLDCGVCQLMAEDEAEWVSSMRAEGIDVHVITLMGKTLSDAKLTPSPERVQDWIDTYGLTDPVLADKGVGPALFSYFLAEYAQSVLGSPSMVLVNPEMTIFDGTVGFDSWDDLTERFRAEAAR